MPLGGPMSPRGFRRRGRRRGLIVGAAVGAHMANKSNRNSEEVDENQYIETDDTVTKLQELAQLKEQGILTEEEFQQQKAKILSS